MKEEKYIFILKCLGYSLTLAFCFTPFIYMLVTSFSEQPNFLAATVPFVPTVQNYRAIFQLESLHFIDFLRNSLIISLSSAFLCTLIASLAAYAITRLPLAAKSFILIATLSVSMFPPVSLISYLFKIMSSLGWINTYYALIFPYIAWTIPLSLWILASYFAQIPRELDKAGLVDGCSRWQILYKIIFPVARPGIVSAFLLAFIFAFNEFIFALVLTTDHSARTVPVGIALFEGLHGEIPWGTIMAASTVAIIPVVVITILFQRHIIQGLSRGAVKG